MKNVLNDIMKCYERFSMRTSKRVMRVVRLKFILAMFAVTFSPATYGTPLPPEMTAQNLNTLVALEATANDIQFLGLSFDLPIANQTVGTWSGIIEPNGWSLQLSGSLNGVPLSISESGSLNLSAGIVTWTDSGSFGLNPLTGSGQMLLDPSWLQIISEGLFDAGVIGLQGLSVATGPGVAVAGMASAVVIKVGEKVIDDECTETGTVTTTTQGVGIAYHGIPGPNNSNPIEIVQNGTFSDGTTVSFEVTIVPEPTTVTLFSIGGGLVGLHLLLRHHRSAFSGRLIKGVGSYN